MRYSLLTVLCLLLAGTGLFAQLQTVSFNIVPGNAFVRINGEVLDLSKQSTVQLAPGTYTAEIWAERFDILEKEVVVSTEWANAVNVGLTKLSPRYEAYKEVRSQYIIQKLKRTLGDIIVGSFIVGGTYVALTGKSKRLNELEGEINSQREDYESAINERFQSLFAERYESRVAEYDAVQKKSNTQRVVGAAIAGGGLIAGYLYFTKGWRIDVTEPVYEAKNPFVLHEKERVHFSLLPGTSSSPLGFTFNF